MGNIIDYINEYGKFTLDEHPFNEVDSLVLSQFSYLKFDEILKDGVRSADLCAIKEHEAYETLYSDTRFEKVNRELFEAMEASPRFRHMHLFDYVNMVDAQWELQFSAVTCVFDNGFVYIAYRGTDETLVGWKEDFNMAFITPIPAQVKAVQYLNRQASDIRHGAITLGGHSKGGNLAVYAAMKCKDSVRDMISTVYSHDGPGFVEGILDTEDFKRIQSRIRKSVPRSSVVGMVMQTQEEYEVVKCRNIGLLQHDPFNWMIEGDGFKKAERIHKHTYVRDASVNRWISNMDYEERQEFVELLFEIIKGAGSNDLNDFVKNPLAAGRGIKNAIETMDKKDKEIFYGIIKEMSDAIAMTMREYLNEQVDASLKRFRKE